MEMLTSLMPSVMAPASGFSYQVEQDSQDGQPRSQELSAQVPAPLPGMYRSIMVEMLLCVMVCAGR